MCSLPTCTCRVSHLHTEKKNQINIKKQFLDDGRMMRMFAPIGKVRLVCLTGVCPAVCFQMGALSVDFVAACEITAVDSALFQRVRRVGRERMLCPRMNYY